MKKSLTRVLSLVLVLVMMLGVMPVALANDPDSGGEPQPQSQNVSATLSATPTRVKPGDEVTVKITNLPSQVQEEGYAADGQWEWSVSTGFAPTPIGSGSGHGPNEVKITVPATFTGTSFNVSVSGVTFEAEGKPDLNVVGTTTIAVDPPAMNDIEVKGQNTVKVGEELTLTAGALPSGAVLPSNATYEWTVVSGTGAATKKTDSTGSSLTIVGATKGTVQVTVSQGSFESDPFTVTVEEEEGYTVKILPDVTNIDVIPGDVKELSAEVYKGTEKQNASVTWSCTGGGDAITFDPATGKVTVAEDPAIGTVATITATYTPSEGDPVTDTITITLKAGDFRVVVSPESTYVALNGTVSFTAKVYKADGTQITPEANSVTWTSSDATIASFATATVGTLKASASNYGKVTVTATYTKDGKTFTDTAEVVVVAGTISCDVVQTAASSSNIVRLSPKFSKSGLTPYYTFEKVKSRGSIDVAADGDVTGSGASAIVVRIAAYADSAHTVKIAQDITTTVSFYAYNLTPEVTMDADATTMKLGSIDNIKGYSSLLSQMVSGYSTVAQDADKIFFSGLDLTEGKFGGTAYVSAERRSNMASVDLVTFTVGSVGTATFSYEIRATDLNTDAILCKGVATINYDSKQAEIEYTTTYDKAVTFQEADFASVWSKAKMSTNLSYVTFTISNSVPTYGKLYTRANTTNDSYKASYTQKFYYGLFTSSTTNMDLGALTYVPQYNKLNTYDVSIPFVAYGTGTNPETLSGVVTIHLNPTSNKITPRGVFFGTVYDNNGTTSVLDDKTYATQMADIFYEKTNKTLESVVFTLPAPEYATLYSKIPTGSSGNTLVAQGIKLKAGDRLTVSSSLTGGIATTQLNNVAIVPAAGCKGQLTVHFTGYAPGESVGTLCSITFNVESKTASAVFSDVTSKNYSWASDSVDFLYYEGTAQGSNGKYNPAANITRQDFMLMLYRAFLAEDYDTFKPTSNFPDVPVGTTAYAKEIYQAVGVAKYLGIAQGTNNKFNPKSNITRQEAMVLIYRTLDTINKDLRTTSNVRASSFKDYSQIGSWATTAISNLVGHGVIQGTNDYIKPAANITRAEMAAILHRVITY